MENITIQAKRLDIDPSELELVKPDALVSMKDYYRRLATYEFTDGSGATIRFKKEVVVGNRSQAQAEIDSNEAAITAASARKAEIIDMMEEFDEADARYQE